MGHKPLVYAANHGNMPLVEISTFPLSEAYAADHTLTQTLSNLLKGVDGCHAIYFGFQEEDKSKGYAVVLWESMEHYLALAHGPSAKEVAAAAQLLVDGPVATTIDVEHVHFAPDPSTALSAPITEIGLLIPKAGKEGREGVDQELAGMAKGFEKVKGGHPPFSWGTSVQKPELTVVLAGWDSVQAHKDVVSAAPDSLSRLPTLVDIRVFHASFTKV